MALIENLAAAARQAARLCTADTLALLQEGLVFHCPLSSSKRRNLTIEMVSQRLLRYGEWALPHILHVGVTTMCNLKCPACPTGNGTLGRPAEHLAFDLYARTVDELRDTLMLQLFWDWGEPLMHPRLPDMIEYASRSGIMTVVSTNGTVANSEQQIDRLVSARPSVVIVCVDGADQQTYEKYRAGGKLSKVLDTIRRLRAAKERHGSPYPVVEFRTLAIRDNEHQMPELLSMATDCGADLLNVKSLRPFDYRGTNVDSELVPLGPAMSRYAYGEAVRDPARRLDSAGSGPLRCAKPHHSPTLNSDGSVSFCSYAAHPQETLGEAGAEGFRKLWRSRRSREIRMRFTRRGGSETCDTCYFRSDHPPTILHQVPLRELPPNITLAWPKTASEFLAACSSPRSC
jgi:MoaA/NifB/PqqE/SkfB family radical SAM enzyme